MSVADYRASSPQGEAEYRLSCRPELAVSHRRACGTNGVEGQARQTTRFKDIFAILVLIPYLRSVQVYGGKTPPTQPTNCCYGLLLGTVGRSRLFRRMTIGMSDEKF